MKPKLSARQDLHSCEHTVNVKSGESQKGFKEKKIGNRLGEDSSRKRQGKKRLQGISFYFQGFLQQDYLLKQRAKHPISDLIKVCRLMATKADQAEPGAKTGVTV